MILICVHSALTPDNGQRRLICRDVWAQSTSQAQVRFMLGAGAPTYSDEVCLPLEDSYDNLAIKTREMCRWALFEQGWDYLLKCDDDTYVHIPRLVAFASTFIGHYTGAEHMRGCGYASGGGGYLISRHFASLIANTDPLPPHPRGAEDVCVGVIAFQNGIAFQANDRFVPYATADLRPRPDNDLITAHFAHQSHMMYSCKGL